MKTTIRNVMLIALAGVLFAPLASAQNFNTRDVTVSQRCELLH